MAKIKIILEDDNGQILNEQELAYQLNIEGGNFSKLEGEIDLFQKAASSKLTATFLEYLQNEATKKKSLKAGGNMEKDPLNFAPCMVE